MKLLRRIERLPSSVAMALLAGLERKGTDRILQEKLKRQKKEHKISPPANMSTLNL